MKLNDFIIYPDVLNLLYEIFTVFIIIKKQISIEF
jgi:hypothetical protein